MREQKAKAQVKKLNYEIIPTPWYQLTTAQPRPSANHLYNSTMDTEFLVQMRQSNKRESVRKDEIFNLHLGP